MRKHLPLIYPRDIPSWHDKMLMIIYISRDKRLNSGKLFVRDSYLRSVLSATSALRALHTRLATFVSTRPSSSAAGARLWIIRGRDRPRYILVIFSSRRHCNAHWLVNDDIMLYRDWLARAANTHRQISPWLTGWLAGRDSATATFVDMKLSGRIRAPLPRTPHAGVFDLCVRVAFLGAPRLFDIARSIGLFATR